MIPAIPGLGCDMVEACLEYEGGDMSADRVVVFFQYLVDSGLAYQLQGSYGRMAETLIAAGFVKRSPKQSRDMPR